MLLSYDWLKKYVNIPLNPVDLAEKIERTSVEVDSVKKRSDGLKKIVVGKVLSVKDHQNSDHLKITQVDVGEDEPLQIVCGAPNVAAGKKVIVALPGSRIADNVKIKRSKMRGVESSGMLCALDEIGFPKSIVPNEWKDGIYFLPDDAKVGDDVFSYLGMNEALLDLDVTPNRGDMLSVRGVSYDLAAVFDEENHFNPKADPEKGNEKTDKMISAEANAELAPTYHLKAVKNTQVKPSPRWLQIRLMNAGIKPINNIVDVTNYVMMLTGQPLHAYDYDKLKQKKLSVRNALNGETITTLDGKERKLDAEDVVIASDKPEGLAGLMGGQANEVTDQTKNVILEAGVFEPTKTRRMAQRYNLHTDASQRFERGVDRGNVVNSLTLAASLVQSLTDGEAQVGFATGSSEDVKPCQIEITVAKINHVLGTDLSEQEVKSIFHRLGFSTSGSKDDLTVTVPTRAWDIHIPADLIEEVARIYGYDKINSTLPVSQTTLGGLPPKQSLMRKSRTILLGLGLTHAISYSLTTEDKAKQFMLANSLETKLQWPMTNDHSVLRMNLISGLLDDIAYNKARNVNDVALFEQGRVFFRTDKDNSRPNEVEHVAGAISGKLVPDVWDQKEKSVDFYQIKGIVQRYLESFSLRGKVNYEQNSQILGMHPGRTADITLDGKPIGFVGQVHPKTAENFKINDTFVFELDFDALFNAAKSDQQYVPVPHFPAIKRDIAFLVNQGVNNEKVLSVIKKAGGSYLQDISVFDVYNGKNVPVGKKSLAYSLTFQNPRETLNDKTADKAMEKISNHLMADLNAEIR